MSVRGARLGALLGMAGLVVALALWIGAERLAQLAVRQAMMDPAIGPAGAAAHVRGVFITWGLVVVLLVAFAGWLGGSWIARQLRALRAALLQHGREGGEPSLPATRMAETRAVRDAAELALRTAMQQKQQLHFQHAALSSVVESVQQGLLRVDEGRRVSFANAAAQSLLALPAGIVGQQYSAVLRDVELRRLLDDTLRGETRGPVELSLGGKRVLVTAQRVRLTDGSSDGVVVTLTDLTALRRLEGVRRDFVANVSHELKTPLTSIRGYIETLLQEEHEPELRTQFLETVDKNARRLQQIVDELLDLSRIESGAWQPALEDVDAAAVVREVWQDFAARAEDARVQFDGPSESVRVRTDAAALRHILCNLFDNALRYTPAGGAISVRFITHGGGVWCEVRDTGTGIPRDALPRVFERFYRVDPARSRAEGGTGLGLSIVKHMVEAMSGEVQAESELGKGTTIRFRLATS